MNFSQKLNDIGYYNEGEYKNLYSNGEAQVAYSDGDIEEVIFEKLNTLPNDKFEREKILEDAIQDWPTKYHFCWERANLLKPIGFGSNDRVLELGGGTGVLSHYICSKVKELVTIEGTLSRAKSISARCKNYDNINIIVANFLKLDMIELFGEHSFDKITIIGVLEYVPKFSTQENGIIKLLEICNKLIKPDGELIIAIENKIGLKYLLGFQEDHNAKAYYGPQSFYKNNETTTFTKQELNAKLNAASFDYINYYLPFPDYKLPSVIIKDCEDIYSKQGNNLVKTLLYDSQSKNYSGKESNGVQEGRVLANFITEKQLDVISNSFLLVARKNERKEKTEPFTYYFSNNRRFEYANEIKFYKQGDIIKASKTWYGKTTNDNVLNLVNEGVVETDFIEGDNVHISLDDLFILDEKEKYNVLFSKWLVFLKTNLSNDEAKAFDMMPFNTILDEKDVFHFIDVDEWQTLNSLSVSQVVSRYVMANKNHFEWLLSTKKEDTYVFINRVLEHFDLSELKEDEISNLENLNVFLNNYVSRKPYFKKRIKPKQSIPKRVIKKFLPYRFHKYLKK